MDSAFLQKIGDLVGKGSVVFSIGHNTFLQEDASGLLVKFVTEDGRAVEHRLRTIEELVEGDAPFLSSDDDWVDKYLPLLTAIESAISRNYRDNVSLKDKTVIAALDRLIMRPDIRMSDSLASDIQWQLRLMLSTTPYSKKELVGCLRKVQRSAKRHHSVDGPTGYVDFIKGKV